MLSLVLVVVALQRRQWQWECWWHGIENDAGEQDDQNKEEEEEEEEAEEEEQGLPWHSARNGKPLAGELELQHSTHILLDLNQKPSGKETRRSEKC